MDRKIETKSWEYLPKNDESIKDFLEENWFEKEKLLKEYWIPEEELYDIIVNNDISMSNRLNDIVRIIKNNNKFSFEKHWKSEKHYKKVVSRKLWNSFSEYQKEKRAKQIDYLEKDILGGHAMEIRVKPGMINLLRIALWVDDFKWWGYWWNRIYLSAPEDVNNAQIIKHEWKHVLQQQAIWFINWVVDSFIKQPKRYRKDRKWKDISVGELTTRIPNEMACYSDQHVRGVLDWEWENDAYKYEGEEWLKYWLEKIQRANYGLLLESFHLDEQLTSIIYRCEQILKMKNFDGGEKSNILSELKKIRVNVINLNRELRYWGDDLWKRDDLASRYEVEIDNIRWILEEMSAVKLLELTRIKSENMWEINGIKSENMWEINENDEDFVGDEIIKMKQNVENIKHDLQKNKELNNESVKDRDMRVFNQVPKVKDIERVIRIFEEKLKELKDGKHLVIDENWQEKFKPTSKLKEIVASFKNEIINENLLYMFDDYFKVDDKWRILDTVRDTVEDSDTDVEKLEKLLKELYERRAEYQRTPTFIWLEEKWHQDAAENMADITLALMKCWVDDDKISKILSDIRENVGVDFDQSDIFDKYWIDYDAFLPVLEEVKKENQNDKKASKRRPRLKMLLEIFKNRRLFTIPLMPYRD